MFVSGAITDVTRALKAVASDLSWSTGIAPRDATSLEGFCISGRFFVMGSAKVAHSLARLGVGFDFGLINRRQHAETNGIRGSFAKSSRGSRFDSGAIHHKESSFRQGANDTSKTPNVVGAPIKAMRLLTSQRVNLLAVSQEQSNRGDRWPSPPKGRSGNRS